MGMKTLALAFVMSLISVGCDQIHMEEGLTYNSQASGEVTFNSGVNYFDNDHGSEKATFSDQKLHVILKTKKIPAVYGPAEVDESTGKPFEPLITPESEIVIKKINLEYVEANIANGGADIACKSVYTQRRRTARKTGAVSVEDRIITANCVLTLTALNVSGNTPKVPVRELIRVGTSDKAVTIPVSYNIPSTNLSLSGNVNVELVVNSSDNTKSKVQIKSTTLTLKAKIKEQISENDGVVLPNGVEELNVDKTMVVGQIKLN